MLPLLLAFVAIVAAASAFPCDFQCEQSFLLGCLPDGCTRSKNSEEVFDDCVDSTQHHDQCVPGCVPSPWIYDLRSTACQSSKCQCWAKKAKHEEYCEQKINAEDIHECMGRGASRCFWGVVNDNDEGSEKYCLWAMFMERYDQTFKTYDGVECADLIVPMSGRVFHNAGDEEVILDGCESDNRCAGVYTTSDGLSIVKPGECQNRVKRTNARNNKLKLKEASEMIDEYEIFDVMGYKMNPTVSCTIDFESLYASRFYALYQCEKNDSCIGVWMSAENAFGEVRNFDVECSLGGGEDPIMQYWSKPVVHDDADETTEPPSIDPATDPVPDETTEPPSIDPVTDPGEDFNSTPPIGDPYIDPIPDDERPYMDSDESMPVGDTPIVDDEGEETIQPDMGPGVNISPQTKKEGEAKSSTTAVAAGGAAGFMLLAAFGLFAYRRNHSKKQKPVVYGTTAVAENMEKGTPHHPPEYDMLNSMSSTGVSMTSNAENRTKFLQATRTSAMAKHADLHLHVKSILDTNNADALGRNGSNSSTYSTSSVQKTARGNVVMEGGFYRRVTVKRITHEELQLDDGGILAQGAFGEVFIATYAGRRVAAKSPRFFKSNQDEAQRFADEILVLARLKHPRIVEFIGACVDKPPMLLVCELAPKGDLRGALRNKVLPETFSTRLQILKDVADALVFLHYQDPIVIHRDIKGANVLLYNSWRAKLCDFGQSREQMEMTMTNQQGTAAWMAPEMILGKQYNEKVDVYSTGIVGWELFCAQSIGKFNPYEGMPQSGLLVSVAVEGLRPLVSRECNPQIADVLGRCWSGSKTRPTASELSDILASIVEETPAQMAARLKACDSYETALDAAISKDSMTRKEYAALHALRESCVVGDAQERQMLRRAGSRAHIAFARLSEQYKPAKHWTLGAWLANVGLPQYEAAFEEADVTSRSLVAHLDGDDLENMGITNIVHKKVILKNRPFDSN